MNLSDNNKDCSNCSLEDDNDHNVDNERKRMRVDSLGASSQQLEDGCDDKILNTGQHQLINSIEEEPRGQEKTPQLQELNFYQKLTEQLLLENAELGIKLSNRDGEIKSLQAEVEKQRKLLGANDANHQLRESGALHLTGKKPIMSIDSTDDDIHLSSPSSVDVKRHKRADEDDGVENGTRGGDDDRKVAAVKSIKVAQRQPNQDSNTNDANATFAVGVENESDEVVEGDGSLAFCCQNCTCNESTTNVQLYCCVNTASLNEAGNIKLFHKGCCHNEWGDVNLFKSPMQINREKGFVGKKTEDGQVFTDKIIKQKHRNAMREETKAANEEFLAAGDSKIYASPVYAAHCENFQQRKGKLERALKVLELFSGIGCGTIALKKLRIPLDSIVHCDHDPIAREVCKFNHNGDGITHVYIETFEEIYGFGSEPDEAKLRKLIGDHGPFDLVLAGAPCSNYSGVNARRDVSCANAQYLPNVGKLITKLNEMQRSANGMENDVLFVSENVVFKDHDHVNECYGGLEPIYLDAKDFSPCKRSRFYWCNIPIDNAEKYTNVASQVSVDCGDILDTESGLLERLFYDSDKHLPVKANTFLACLTKIDDDRMLKVKYSTDASGPSIKLEHYSVREREKMMGLPPGYVSEPLRVVFDEITTNAILRPEMNDGKTYKDFMDEKYWYLRKKIKLQYSPKMGEEPYFEIGIATPLENKQNLAFFKEEQYSKHLIGMGFSVCVIEALLEGIVELFSSNDMLRTYDGFDYSYPWEPYLSFPRDCDLCTKARNDR